MTILAHRVYGPFDTTDTPEEFMRRFAISQKSSTLALIETDGVTFQVEAEMGTEYRVAEEMTGLCVLKLSRH